MNQQYNSLGKSLFLYHSSRLFVITIFFILALAYINNFFTTYTNVFPDESSISNYDRMASIIEASVTTITTVSQTVEATLLANNTNAISNYCTVDLSNSECKAYLFKSIENQLIYKTYSTFTSFSCVQGSCQKVSALWDYFWIFKIRLKYIEYILIEYQLSGAQTEMLVAPACSNYSLPPNNTGSSSNLMLSFSNNQLTLTKISSSSLSNIKVTMAYNNSELAERHIQPTDYTISPASLAPNPGYLVYSWQDTQMFGYLPTTNSFIMKTWLYNLRVLIVCFICVPPLLYFIKHFITSWEDRIFKYIATLDNLYRYQINSIFEGEKPKKSVILSETEFTFFFEDLSQIIDKDCEPMTTISPIVEREQPFKFTGLIDRVMAKFETSLKYLEEQRTHQFSNLKPLIRTSINQISEDVAKKLKDMFMKSREMLMTAQFFYFSYLSLLHPILVYDALLSSQKTPLPGSMVSLFRYMNYTVNSTDLKFAFKFAFAYNHIIQQQIIMKLQDSLLQKYFSTLKDLDAGDPSYATKLKLKKRLTDLEKTIENKRHIFSVYLK